ncbi:MAG: glycosyltransferase [Proteobacteria bacterium]|nr:MAG: glycosyltransferase [Pseudomonadota bacterium]
MRAKGARAVYHHIVLGADFTHAPRIAGRRKFDGATARRGDFSIHAHAHVDRYAAIFRGGFQSLPPHFPHSALASLAVASPVVSVIISAKNEADRLAACFESLAAQKTKLTFEVIVVDNNSTDGTYALARRLAAKQKRRFIIGKQKKAGAPAARNAGAKKARGKILVFTDADCTHSSHWLEEIARPLLEDHHYPLAAMGGYTKSAFAERKRPSLFERYLDGFFSFWDEDRLHAFPAFLPWAPTCNLAVKAEVFKGLGGFDERWKTAAYDVDFCWRLSLCGFVCGYAPKAEARHLRRGTLRAFFRQMENYAYYNHALLTTYEKELELSTFSARKERFLSRGRRTLSLIKGTTNITEARFRGLDGLVNVAALKGVMEAQFTAEEGDPKLSASRQGITPKTLRPLLTRGYTHLHNQGWCYWKNPSDVESPGDLILFQPRTSERFRLNETAWKVWEIKSDRGQSEDAARALEQDDEDADILRDIDQVTLDLRTRRLLP